MLSEADRQQAVSESVSHVINSYNYLLEDHTNQDRKPHIKLFNENFLLLIQRFNFLPLQVLDKIQLKPIDLVRIQEVPEVIVRAVNDFNFIKQNKDKDVTEQVKSKLNDYFYHLILGNGLSPFQIVSFMRIEIGNQQLLQTASSK